MAIWECVDCCNEFDVPKKPARCSECGSRQLISPDVPGSDNYSGPWESPSGCSEAGAGPETSPRDRESLRDAGRGHLVR